MTTMVELSKSPIADLEQPTSDLSDDSIKILNKARAIRVIVMIATCIIFAASVTYSYTHSNSSLFSTKTCIAGIIGQNVFTMASAVSKRVSAYVLVKLGYINDAKELDLLVKKQELFSSLSKEGVDYTDRTAYTTFLINNKLAPLLKSITECDDLQTKLALKTRAIQIGVYITSLNESPKPLLSFGNEDAGTLIGAGYGNHNIVENGERSYKALKIGLIDDDKCSSAATFIDNYCKQY